MCEWGHTIRLDVTIPASHSSTSKSKRKTVGIDSCIFPIVKALNDAGIATLASCCGHGKRPGIISLADGRELSVLPDRETWEKVESFYTKELGCGPINP